MNTTDTWPDLVDDETRARLDFLANMTDGQKHEALAWLVGYDRDLFDKATLRGAR